MSDSDYITIFDLGGAVLRVKKDGNRNELLLDQKKGQPSDAVKFRIGTWDEGSVAAICHDRLSGEFETAQRLELTLQEMRTDDNFPAGQREGHGRHDFFTTDGPGDAGEKRRLTIGQEIEQFAQAKGAGGNSGSGPVSRFMSPNGKYALQVQDDGNIVQYDTNNHSADESTWRPIWTK